MPCGTKQPTKRGLGAAAVCANATPAGIIASRSGKARVAPALRKTVRRDKCFFLRNVIAVLLLILGYITGGLARGLLGGVGQLHVGLERRALHDAEDKRREPVVIGSGFADDAAKLGHILILDAAAQGISHELFG